MYYARVNDLTPENANIRVSLDILTDEGDAEGIVESKYLAFPATITEKELELEIAKIVSACESDAKQAAIQAENEAVAKNVDNLRKHFLEEESDE